MCFVLTFSDEQIAGGQGNVRSLSLFWACPLGVPLTFSRLLITDTNTVILYDSEILKQVADALSDNVDLFEARLQQQGFVREMQAERLAQKTGGTQEA